MVMAGRNDPCPCGSGKKYKHCCYRKLDVIPAPSLETNVMPSSRELVVSAPTPLPRPEFPRDRPVLTARRMDEVLHEATQRLERGELDSSQSLFEQLDEILVDVAERIPTTPADEAQELVRQATAVKGRKQERLIEQALALDPECVSAYLLRGYAAPTARDALPHLNRALVAAERALGHPVEPVTDESYGADPATLDYLHVRFAIAEALFALDRRADAAVHLREVLRLDPADDVGAHNLLLPILLTLGEDEEADKLIRAFPDTLSPFWDYSRALVKFRLHGDSIFARRALNTAIANSPRVTPYLLGEKRLPKHPPLADDPTDEEYAQLYATAERERWQQTPGALDWLRLVLSPEEQEPGALESRPTGPAIFLNPYPDMAFTRCPECDQKTKTRQRHLVVMIEPSVLLVPSLQCRYCPTDDLLIVHRVTLEPILTASLQDFHPEFVDNEYVVLGTIENAEMRRRPHGPVDFAWILEHLQPPREHYVYDDWDEEPDDDDLDFWGPPPALLLPPSLTPPAAPNPISKFVSKLKR